MKDFSYITNSSPAFIENMYHEFVANPENVDADFRKFFEGFDFAVGNGLAGKNGAAVSENGAATKSAGKNDWRKEIAVYRLILGYRNKGHLLANTNPIKKRKDRGANVELSFYGLSEADLDTEYEVGNLIGLGTTTLRNIFTHLQNWYASHVGVEFKYISDQKKVDWITNEIERNFSKPFPLEKKKRILEKLNQGVMFEKFLHTKYVGQKRFSLEGGETTIAALDAIINISAELDVKEAVIGMAHRGRLNVLANILGKTYEQIFSEFEGTGEINQTMGSGDVKYHLGYGSEIETTGGNKIHLKLMPNPSHLEAVDPVVLGFARSSANNIHDEQYDKVLPILIHGDAAVAGQGVVYELLQMSKLPGYQVGGTIHFIINNQIGFTTDFSDARSADYCTSLAAMTQSPVFHVNGDDPEAVVKCAEIATRYRSTFHDDVFIDMVCYRKHGHNEGDDPKFTQPAMYALIDKHPNPREVYVKYLLDNGEEDAKDLAKEMETKFWADLQDRLDDVKQRPLPYTYQTPELLWKQLRKATEADFDKSPVTGITEEKFNQVFNAIMTIPEGFTPLKKVDKLLKDKVKLFNEEAKLDWATAELLAFGSVMVDGADVRMSGQDVGRGTFSSRHCVLRDEVNDKPYNRLAGIPGAEGKIRMFNSLLSENAVLGFEYGYALSSPNALVLWEAQFGDFVNGAQTIIDQFITGAEQKWNRMNGLVMLLPHGYEGQGPEHSSARMERFLIACAELNIVVTNITTAANYFHALRRQLAWPFRKPLINFAPKANLRHPGTYSAQKDFLTGSFQELIDDSYVKADEVKKVLFCSGKVYYDLLERQQKEGRKDVAVVRLEQIYPLPGKQLAALYNKYKNAVWYWVQEEPLNMGAASFLQMNLKHINYGIIGRKASASTASGFMKVHKAEQEEIVNTAFTI
ncbi:2-oxoglutarate dehydrogenase E1 component [Niabella yanshanensis]|uniref:oxoglutarate dehydrogenase (succinyl-transferring) n=1 Tax=Niabella yanshanensis TaxID=577386 RepID=A0ABZ0WCQ3_9BACT|nr:2-oxoglutarate dehydrogenase E1 component [Niabella yanshanensis]WQD40075.1 2-oxoglutarate dehydrogenase E1 component [Niabella yanshanensis]